MIGTCLHLARLDLAPQRRLSPKWGLASTISQRMLLLCLGHPLLDLQVTGAPQLLEKYGLNANDAILAQESHELLYDELVRDYEVAYVAGGASQNTARGAAYVLPPGSVVFTGCVGDDDLAEQLRVVNAREGVQELYQVRKGARTGACGVLITGQDRSLVTSLRAAKTFQLGHLLSPEVSQAIEKAVFYYAEGFMLSQEVDTVRHVCKLSAAEGKTFAFNISAPYIPKFHNDRLSVILPMTDIVFLNEIEAECWASSNGYGDLSDTAMIGKALVSLPRSNGTGKRIVVITHGPEPTIVVSSVHPDQPLIYPVHPLKKDEIVDTNGAGDAFAGGFMGALVTGKDLDACVEAGHKLGAMCVRQIGATYIWPKVAVL